MIITIQCGEIMNDELKIYAIRDKSTGKFVKNLTSPNHKFWEKRGFAENALKNFLRKCENNYSRPNYNPDDLELVELYCYEKPEAMKIAESLLPPIEEMRDFTPEEQEEHRKCIESMSKPIIGANGKPVNIIDLF